MAGGGQARLGGRGEAPLRAQEANPNPNPNPNMATIALPLAKPNLYPNPTS